MSIILAGGKSSRMGEDKAFLKFEGRSLIEWVIAGLKEIGEEIIIVANESERFKSLGLRVVKDILPDKGPLVGLYSGLLSSHLEYNFVCGTDMPFLSPSLIKYMLGQEQGCDVILPRIGGRVEPLFAIYKRSCLSPIAEVIKEGGQLSLRSFFDRVKIRYIKEDEIIPFGLPEKLFFNINTREDMERARGLLEEKLCLA
ncbi:molybdenum cofactor guanylyltransferase [bacterium]|nr:molybdenum cofactor guanylyltransferase [bacterium]